MLARAALLATCLAASVVSAEPSPAAQAPVQDTQPVAAAPQPVEQPKTLVTHDAGHDLGDVTTLSLARFAGRFDVHLVAPDVVEHLVQWNRGARDLVHDAADRLAAVSDSVTVGLAPPPDLSILTTDPLAAMSTHQSSGFGWRDDPIHHDTRYHAGTDFRSPYGTPVLAAGDGVVTFAGRQGGYGNVVYVDHGGGVTTRYAHLRKIEIKKDATLTAGQEIGEVGSTGRATGPHLHFEVRIDGHAVSPILAMTVADLQRTAPESGHIAAYALSPELAAHALAGVDHPRGAPPKTKAKPESRPDRPSRVKRPVTQT